MKRFENTKKVGLIGIFANIFLFIIKITYGLSFKSQSMIADSFNSIGDVFASFMTFIGNKIASVKSDDDHNFGHGKAEYLFSMFISISILFIGIKLLFDSVSVIYFNKKIIYSISLIIVSIITIITKLILYFYVKCIYQKNPNLLIKSNMIDHRNDIFLSICVLISIICSKFGIDFIDGLVGIIISIWFLLSGIKLFKESYMILMDISLDGETKNIIVNLIKQNKNIINVKKIHSISIGYKYVVVLTITVDGNLSTFKSHAIATKVEKDIKKHLDIIDQVIVHINPI